MTQYISFPGLFDKIFEINNVAFTVFGWEIKWYGVILAAAFLLGSIYVMRRADKFGTNSDTVIDLLIFLLPLCIIGSRVYYVANTWDYYSRHLSEIPQIWNGGLAIYGSIIMGIIVIFFFGKFNKKRFDTVSFLDVASIGLLIGQCIGRWGNFVNGEAFGTATSLPFGMVISDTLTSIGTAVHPTFLYESLWTLAGFIALHFYSKHRKFKGEIFALYCVWYGLGRGFIEGLRTDSLYIASTNIRISQVVAFAGCAVGIAFLAYMYATKKYKAIKMLTLEPAIAGLIAEDCNENAVIIPETISTETDEISGDISKENDENNEENEEEQL